MASESVKALAMRLLSLPDDVHVQSFDATTDAVVTDLSACEPVICYDELSHWDIVLIRI